MAIPVDISGVIWFTPESLEAMGDLAPAFRIKTPSERCLRRFQQMVGDDGLVTYSAEEFTAEKLKAIALCWEGNDAAITEYRDRLGTLVEKGKQGIEISPAELAWADELDDLLFEDHKPLRVMRRKTNEFNEYALRHALAIYLAGWKNLDVPFRLEGGVLQPDCISALAKALRKLGDEYCPKSPSKPFVELYERTTRQLRMDEDEEKNLPAPSLPGATPAASPETATTAGASSAAKAAGRTASSSSKRKTARPAG